MLQEMRCESVSTPRGPPTLSTSTVVLWALEAGWAESPFFSEVSRYFFQDSWQQGRISDALPSLHWVRGCILLWTSAPWPAHSAAQATVPTLGTHTALSLAYSSLLLTRSVLLLRTISSREGSHSKQSGPWCHSSILRLQNTWGGLQTYRMEECNKATCPSNIWPTAIQAFPLCQASPITWMF